LVLPTHERHTFPELAFGRFFNKYTHITETGKLRYLLAIQDVCPQLKTQQIPEQNIITIIIIIIIIIQ